MKITKTQLIGFVCFILLPVTAIIGQSLATPPQQVEPVVNFKVPLSKANQVIYAIRYTQIMDAKTANELADLLVNQANDTTLNKPQRTVHSKLVKPDTNPFPASTGSKGKN